MGLQLDHGAGNPAIRIAAASVDLFWWPSLFSPKSVRIFPSFCRAAMYVGGELCSQGRLSVVLPGPLLHLQDEVSKQVANVCFPILRVFFSSALHPSGGFDCQVPHQHLHTAQFQVQGWHQW
jgi:hypothetical protein